MNSSNMKNMIVVKNLPSNIIEEAFIILKPNKKLKVQNYVGAKQKEQNQREELDGYVVKEAEMVISNYLSNIEKQKEVKSMSLKKMESKYKKLRSLTIFLAAVVTVSLLKMLI